MKVYHISMRCVLGGVQAPTDHNIQYSDIHLCVGNVTFIGNRSNSALKIVAFTSCIIKNGNNNEPMTSLCIKPERLQNFNKDF